MFEIYPVLCRAGKMDNYSYILVNKANNLTLVIDPSEAAPIKQKLEELGAKPNFILNTHHHFDHTDANKPLKEKYGAQVIGNETDKHRIPEFDLGVEIGKSYELYLPRHELRSDSDAAIQIKQISSCHPEPFICHPEHPKCHPEHPKCHPEHPKCHPELVSGSPTNTPHFTVLDASAHTQGHVLYYFPNEKALFTGDTLFNLSIGGLFEGTPEQMFQALLQIKSLPEDTLFYPGHEYTAYGANQAYHACNGNDAIQNYLQKAQTNLRQNLPAGPFTLHEEISCNPYLRAATLEEFKKLF